MDAAAAARVVELFEGGGQLDRLERVAPSDAQACLARADPSRPVDKARLTPNGQSNERRWQSRRCGRRCQRTEVGSIEWDSHHGSSGHAVVE